MWLKKNYNLVKILTFLLFASTLLAPQEALAARKDAGGGDIEKFSNEKFAINTAITLGSMYIGNAISSGINASAAGSQGYSSTGQFLGKGASGTATFSQGFGSSLSSGLSLNGVASNLGTATALTQVGNAVGAMGNYYGWNPKTTLFISSVAQGVGSGVLNPASASPIQGVGGTLTGGSLGVNDGLLTRAAFGGIEGAIEGGILVSAADSKGRVEPWVGPVANLASSFTTGVLAAGLTSQGEKIPTDPTKLQAVNENGIITYQPAPIDRSTATFKELGAATWVNQPGKTSFGNINKFNFQSGFERGFSNVVRALPATAISTGVGYATQKMDWQDRQMVQAAVTGLYPVAGTLQALPDNINRYGALSEQARTFNLRSMPDKDWQHANQVLGGVLQGSSVTTKSNVDLTGFTQQEVDHGFATIDKYILDSRVGDFKSIKYKGLKE